MDTPSTYTEYEEKINEKPKSMNVNEVWGRASLFLERLIVVEKKRNIMTESIV